MIVLVSFTSFWIDQNKTLARLFIVITSLLTMATMVSNLNKSLPITSYTKAIDIYTGICLTFVFLALLETCTVQFFNIGKRNSSGQSEETDKEQTHVEGDRFYVRMMKITKLEMNRLDLVAVIAFPSLFLIFNIAYWTRFIYISRTY